MAHKFPACNSIRQKLPEEEKTKLFFGQYFLYSDILRFSHRVIFPFGEVVLKSYDFSDILFAINCRRQYHLNEVQISLRSNSTRRKANKTAQVSLRTLGQSTAFFERTVTMTDRMALICKNLRKGFSCAAEFMGNRGLGT